MLVPNQKFVVRRHRSNKEHYNSLGYYNEPWAGTFEVPAEHLANHSPQEVLFTCDDNPDHPPYLMSMDHKSLGIRCPTCAGQGVRKGVYFADRFPELLKFWSEKNTISPSECKSGSPRKVWWKCEQGKNHPDHEMSPFHKGTKKQKCPYCVGLKLCDENSLAKSYPHLLEEWHPRNEKSPSEYFKHSKYKVWWRCSACSYDWETSIANRTKSVLPTSCPKCAKYGFQLDKPAKIYLVRWYGEGIEFLKMGITNRDTVERIAQQHNRSEKKLNYEILYEFPFSSGVECRKMEQLLIDNFEMGFAPKEVFPDGHTETTSMANLPRIVEFLHK